QSPTEAGESSTYLAARDGDEGEAPPTPTYTAESPTYQDEDEPETPVLEPDDEELYAWEEEQLKSGHAPTSLMVDLSVLSAPAEPAPADELRSLPPAELARRLAAPGALAAARRLGLTGVRGAAGMPSAAPRLPGMEPPTPSLEPDEEGEDFQLLRDLPEDVYLPPARPAVTRRAEEELPPWKRRLRRRQE
ncbi:Hypothetical protein (Fragment), partial [Durusdinium trenchii]